MRRTTKLFAALILTTLLIPSVSDAKGKKRRIESGSDIPATFRESKTLAGTINVDFSVVTLAKYKKDVDEVYKYTFSEIDRIARLFNSTDPGSDLARVAENAGQAPVAVSKETLALAELAKKIADWTHGAFDPIRGPGTYKSLKINKKNSTIYLKKPGTSLELRGILEGFMADLFTRAAYHANLDDSFVNVGGVWRAMGSNSYGPWQILLSGNGKKKAKRGMNITISNYSAATVGGDYFAPAVDPRSGKPINTPFYSVTVLCQQAATAQGVATSIYIMGPDAGEDLINALGIRAIYAYNDGGFKKVGRW